VESGRNNDRPEREKESQLARITGITLVIAKLDRLSRNAAFLLTLRDSGVRFVARDMPEANDLTLEDSVRLIDERAEAARNLRKDIIIIAHGAACSWERTTRGY